MSQVNPINLDESDDEEIARAAAAPPNPLAKLPDETLARGHASS